MRHVELTDAGRALMRRLDEMRADAQLRLWDHLGNDERAAVFRAMELLAAVAKRARQEEA